MSGNSMPEGKPYAIEKIIEMAPLRILDVGAGRGAYAWRYFGVGAGNSYYAAGRYAVVILSK
jgi:hypothetical protein